MAERPLVSVFIYGLRPDWVDKMPFVRSIAQAEQLATVLGYSIACHATMYTGLSIREHGLWFVWERNERSAFPQWFGKIPRLADNIPSRLVARKAAVSRMKQPHPRGYFGVPRLINVPMRHWPGLWVSEERFWADDDYVAAGPTLFELMRRQSVRYLTLGLQHGGHHLETV